MGDLGLILIFQSMLTAIFAMGAMRLYRARFLVGSLGLGTRPAEHIPYASAEDDHRK
jgi:hypothetical protein